MNKTFISKEFTTKKELPTLKRELKNEIARYFGFEREQVKIPWGCVKLQRKTENNDWVNVTQIITDFEHWIKKGETYRLATRELSVN